MKSNCTLLVIVLAICGCQTGPRNRETSSSTARSTAPSAIDPPVAPRNNQLPATVAATPSRVRNSAPTSLPSRLPPQTNPSQIRLASARQPNVPESVGAPQPSDASAGPTSLPAPASSSSEPTNAPQSARPLSLSDALATSLAENPDLITIRGTANVGSAAVDVAGVYPWNPFVQGQFFPNGKPFLPGSPGNASGQSNYYIWVMQRFELAHQRQHREDSAIAALGQIRWNIQQAELLNVAQTERLFFTAVYQRQLRELAADAETLSDRLAGVIQRRFKAGLATSVQNINAQVAVRQTRRQRELADATYQAALLALRQQLGMPASTSLDLSGDLSQYDWFSVAAAACRVSGAESDDFGDPQLLAQEMVEGRPDVLASRSAIAMSQANLRLARAARVPDVQAGPIYDTADDGTRFIGLRLQRDIGIWNNGSALANQRMTEVQQQRLTYEQLKRRAGNEAAASIDRYERARHLAADAAQEASNNPPPELEQVLREFEAGNAEILDVVAVQNNLLQETRSYLDLLNEVAQSAALVTQTTAIPPERLFAQRPPKFSRPAAP